MKRKKEPPMKRCRFVRDFSRGRGVGLLELLISISLAMVLLSSLFTLYYGAARGAAKDENRNVSNRESQLISQRLMRDLRLPGLMAPLDIDGNANDINRDVPGQTWSDSVRQDFEYGNTYSLAFTADIDNDGRTETTRYRLDRTAHQIKEATWKWNRDSVRWTGPVERIIGRNVDYLAFKFFDKDGVTMPNPMVYPVNGYTLSAGERQRVTEVEVTIVTRSEHEENGHVASLIMPDGTHWSDKYTRLVNRFVIRGRNLSLGA
jgi:type II secretory pathway pseudopilin PulG